MSSSPAEVTVGVPAGAGKRRGGWLKRILPRTLFGRSILILVTPLILMQAVAAWVLFDRLWDTVSRRLCAGVAGDIAVAIDGRDRLDDPDSRRAYFDAVSRATDLGFDFAPEAVVPAPSPAAREPVADLNLRTAMVERVRRPFAIEDGPDPRGLMLLVQLEGGVLRVSVPKSRLQTYDAYIFMFWMVGTGLLTCAVAMLFLKNQVRSLRRLAVAADAFGKGRDLPGFRPEGAAEVRQAAAAFLVMRERIRRQISQRTEMLAGVSHDLRTPLTRMKLELELLGDGEDTQALKTDVAEMQQMIEGYLSFARGEGDEQPKVVDVLELLQELVANAARDGTAVELSGPEELHMPVRRDAFRRCVSNLVSNAARYGKHVWITVLPGRNAVDVLVDDDGPGIPEALREAVFRPFVRLEGSRNPATGGVGLGLSIALDIARGHGGDLTLETSPHGGLRARLHLPR